MKNTVIGILLIITVGSLVFGYLQRARLEELTAVYAMEKEALQKEVQQQELIAKESRKMAELAQHEAEIQRTICEEQLKALKKQ